ncbi:stalk domain-containing protein, partial [Paenibacillus albidus]|uniref:stalk domain-containing protein n=1 Tax=Paenibacillus albidus TaxID=2041023 RepID=UPI0027E3BDA0
DGSGAKSGNRTSIGVEICESGDYTKTLDNAAGLVASMLKERGWGIDRLRRHFDWSGKICPRLMYDGGKWTGWTAFKAAVVVKLKEGDKVYKDLKVSVLVNGKKVADGVLDAGVTYTPARAVAEALGAVVTYDAATKTVNITK